MKWEGREESGNVEDRRGMSGKAGLAIGGGGGAILLLVLGLVFGPDVAKIAEQMGVGKQGPPQQQGRPDGPRDPAEEKMASFSKVILHDTEVVWDEQFKRMRPPRNYEQPTLVLFTDRVQTKCGEADSGVGPFYCPGDSKVYIDLSFYTVMERQLKAPGDFARAYVIAHEVGHHVQRLLGYSQRVNEARGTPLENQMSVRLELQADYLAGVWAHHAQKRFNFLERGDIESAINAANQIGDDTLQKRAGRIVVPHTFTHGSSAQRMRWFQAGLESGDVNGADQLFALPYNQL